MKDIFFIHWDFYDWLKNPDYYVTNEYPIEDVPEEIIKSLEEKNGKDS